MAHPPRLTPQQRAILDALSTSVAVSAGAGCGKTFVLTQRFLAFLRPNPGGADPLARIVAITFTEKAAREMRHRVRGACQDELLRCDEGEVPHWLAVLRGLDTARIGTIHSFCATLLRTHAVEAGLDPNFGLLDPSFGDVFVRRTVRDAVCRLLERADRDASDLVVRFGFERALSLIGELMAGARTAGMTRFDGLGPDDLIAAWRGCWGSDCLPALVRDFRASPAVRSALDLLGAYEPDNAVMSERRSVLLELFARDAWPDPAATLEQIREHAQVKGGGGKAAWPNEAVYAAVTAALKGLREEIDRLLGHLAAAEADGSDAAATALLAHRVIKAVASDYDRRKRDEARLDFDDLLCLARDLLRDHPGVRRRAAGSIDLLMVDEFQDTDPVQSELVRHLCGDGLTTGKLFLVGDAKQSIYRFRRADPQVFAALRGELPEAGRLPLTTNFRSQPAILRFVNFTFSTEMPDYEPLVPVDPVQRSPEPCVEFMLAAAEDPAEAADDRRRREARWIADRIALLLEDPTPRVRDERTRELRPVRRGDVAILFRALSNVHLYEQALVENGIDYYLAGGRAFFAQQEIHDVSHLCRWLDDPADELSLAGVLRSPFFGLDDDTLFALKPEKRASLAAGLRTPPHLPETQAEQVRRAHDVLSELRAKKDRLPLHALLSLAVERTGYDAALLCEHLGVRKLANLRKLIGLARSFGAAGTGTLADFAARLREAVREQAEEELAVTHPEVGDVVRLMTIHQAKGLEFPVVVVADMERARPSGDARPCYHPTFGPLFAMPDDGDGRSPHLGLLLHRIQETREEEAELARVLYVAVTRAKDHLVLSAGMEHDGKPRSPWMRLLARRFDLTTGLPALDPYLGSVGGTAVDPAEVPTVRVWHARPSPPSAARRPRADHAPLRRFRELVAETPPGPVPPLVGRVARSEAGRDEFSIEEICDPAGRDDPPAAAASAAASAAAHALPHDGRLPFDDLPAGRDDGNEYAKLLGTVARAVLERLDPATPSARLRAAVSAATERCLLSIRGRVDRRLQRTVANKIVDLLAQTPLGAAFAESRRLARDVEFRLRWDRPAIGPPAQVFGRIDCVYQDADGRWHLVDYATAEEAAADDADVVRRSRLKLAIQAIAFEKLFGTPPSSATLARLGPPTRLHPIDVTPPSLADAARKVDEAIGSLRRGDGA